MRNPSKCSKKTMEEAGILYVSWVLNKASTAHKDAAIMINKGAGVIINLVKIDNIPQGDIKGDSHGMRDSAFFYPDFTVGPGVAPDPTLISFLNQARGLYHRLGIAPYPEGTKIIIA